MMKVKGFKQELPDIFVEKMMIDEQIKNLKASTVISLSEFLEVRSQQELSRYSCMKFIQMQMKPQGSAGSGR